MPGSILGIRISKTGLAALAIGLLAFASLLTGELVRCGELRALEALLATVGEHDGRALGAADEGRRLRVADLALMIAAWAVSLGGPAMLGGIAGLLAMMLLTLWATSDAY